MYTFLCRRKKGPENIRIFLDVKKVRTSMIGRRIEKE